MRLTVTIAAVVLIASVRPAVSQAPQQEPRHRMPIPDKFTNLQVLPKDIPKDDLVQTMRTFSRSLGVRCDFCHEFQDDNPDFASDKKDEKNAARNMMRMVYDINTNYMPKLQPLPGEEKKQTGVNCWTCHRGEKQPAEGPPPEEHHEGPPTTGSQPESR
ncbi:MAG: c-type cytochrome [Terriglobales bacterium]